MKNLKTDQDKCYSDMCSPHQ